MIKFLRIIVVIVTFIIASYFIYKNYLLFSEKSRAIMSLKRNECVSFRDVEYVCKQYCSKKGYKPCNTQSGIGCTCKK